MHANAGSPHASLPDSDVALLANILVLATRNMNNMTTMLAHLSVELSQSEEPRLQRVGHRVLNELGAGGRPGDPVGPDRRAGAFLTPARTYPAAPGTLVTEIHLTELPGQALPPSA